jgi:hypothetical protein
VSPLVTTTGQVQENYNHWSQWRLKQQNLKPNMLDDFVKEPHENPSIGIILCSERSKFDVEYSLRGIDKPVGVAGYELTHDIPEKLKGSLPSPEELEEKILFELGLDENYSGN